MKPHPKIRKTIKWGGAAVTALLVVVWVGSGWVPLKGTCRSISVSLQFGRIEVVKLQTSTSPKELCGLASSASSRSELRWWFSGWADSPTWMVAVPLWLFPGASAVAAALAWRLDPLAGRRARVGFCPKCNYERIGLPPQAVCPECGTAAIVPSPVAS